MIFGLFLGQKWALAAPQELAQQHERHKNVVFLVSGHDGNEEIGGCAQQIDFWPKNRLLGPKRGTLGNRGRKTARQTAIYRKTKVIQSYLRIWGTYDPIESGSSDPKKWGLYGCSVKKCRFSGQKWAPEAAPRPAVQRGQHKNFVFLLSSHDGDKKFGRFPKKKWISGQKTAFLARNSAFFYATPMKPPFFRVRRTGPD